MLEPVSYATILVQHALELQAIPVLAVQPFAHLWHLIAALALPDFTKLEACV